MQKLSALRTTLLTTLIACACSTAPKTSEGKSELQTKAQMVMSNAEAQTPDLAGVRERSAGYAVFPSIGKGAAGVGGAYGKGVLYERGQFAGYCDMTQASVGLQLGGQRYTEIIFFENQNALDKFKASEMAFDAQASAVALEAGASRNFKYTNGVFVVTTNEQGLMAEASLGGQKFSYKPR